MEYASFRNQVQARLLAAGAVVVVVVALTPPTVRPDVKFIPNSPPCQLFTAIPNRIVAVDPFGGEAAAECWWFFPQAQQHM